MTSKRSPFFSIVPLKTSNEPRQHCCHQADLDSARDEDGDTLEQADAVPALQGPFLQLWSAAKSTSQCSAMVQKMVETLGRSERAVQPLAASKCQFPPL